MNWRLGFLAFFFIILAGVLVFQLSTLQFQKSARYVELAQSRGDPALADAPRGSIYFTDKNGNDTAAALTKDRPVIYAVPKEIMTAAAQGGMTVQEISRTLAQSLSLSADDLSRRLSKENSEYELLASKPSEDLVSKIENLHIKGIYVKNSPFRYYSFGILGAQVLGFVSSPQDKDISRSFIGRYGIERLFDDELSGAENGTAKPAKGTDLHLTIDRTIEAEGEDILSRLISTYKATGGTFIVEEPETGKILGMGSDPSFDPNNFSESDVKNFTNPAVQAVYEPGSIFKVITMSAGIDSGKITPETVYVDKGSITLNNRTVSNWDLSTHGPWGRETMTNVIEHSINTGAIFAEQKTGHAIFFDYLKKFGFDEKTGITLPGEVKGSLRNAEKGRRDIDYATASYGQGVSVTPLALVSAISAVANGGLLMKPFILADQKPEVVRRVISEETSQKVKNMMVSAVALNKIAALAQYTVAGKTGTAFIPNFGGKGYTDQVINTYVGFAPAINPRFIILLKLDRPEGAPLAGQTVVPAFRDFTQFLLNYFGVPPDKPAIQ